MTTLRFVGDVPVWAGLTLAIIVAVLSWRYYRRESFDLSPTLRWLLPMLRAGAFFLGIMLLTGPVLNHRRTIGELGQIQFYVDGSSSMELRDRHMSAGRKLQIAAQLGWLAESGVNLAGQETLSKLAGARRHFEASLTSADAPEDVDEAIIGNRAAVSELLSELSEISADIPGSLQESFQTSVLDKVKATDAESRPEKADLDAIATAVLAIENKLRDALDRSLADRINSGDPAVAAALAQFDETPRWSRASAALDESPLNLVEALKENHEVELRTLLGNSAEIVDLSAGNDNATDIPQRFSTFTDLSSGVIANQTGLASSSESDISASEISPSDAATNDRAIAPARREAIVLITDGQHNNGPSPLQTARILGSQGKPIYTVSLGASRPSSDLAVIDVEHPDLVFAKDQVRGVITINDSVPAGQAFVAQVRSGGEVLWQEELTTLEIGRRRIEFQIDLKDAANAANDELATSIEQHVVPVTLTASLSPVASEAELSNNEQSSRIAVNLQTHRLLVLDGRSRWETRYLRNAFGRDDQWRVDTVIAGPGTEHESLPRGDEADLFPTNRDALFEYDLIVFGEISPDMFAAHELDWIREFVELRGGGFVFIDGTRETLQQLSEEDLLSLVPVEWNVPTPESVASSLQLTDRGVDLPALRLLPEAIENKQFWAKLPPPKQVAGATALPGAEVLADVVVDGQSLPAIVTRPFGAGRVLYLAFDETWRWRYKAADTWHQRIWNQLAKFTMPIPFAVSDEYVSLDSGSVSYDEGDSVVVRARLKGLDGKPAIGRLVDGLLWRDGRVASTVSLKEDASVPGLYTGTSGPLGGGEYEVSIRASGYTSDALQARTEFTVNPPVSGELTESSANETLLEQMAIASGGVALREEQLGRLPELLKPLSSGRVVESETLIWQSYWWFVAMMLLLTLEWILRKRAGLL